MLTSLQLDIRYDALFLKTLIADIGSKAWGYGKGDSPQTQVLIFDSSLTEAVTVAINNYDDALLKHRINQLVGMINLNRDRKIESGFMFNYLGESYMIQSKQSDRENVLGLAIAAMGAISLGVEDDNLEWLIPGQPFGFITTDNRVIPLSAKGMMSLYQRGLAFKMSLTLYARSLKDIIENTCSLSELEEININDGWPS